jgi:hypothetical protein
MRHPFVKLEPKQQDCEWHFYDQNFFNYLATHPFPNDVEKFIEILNQILGVDLFDKGPGFKVVNTPLTFLEAIGITSFPNVQNEVIANLNLDKSCIRKVPHEVLKLFEDHFSRIITLSREALINHAERQLIHATNPIVAQLVQDIIYCPLEELKDPLRSISYHKKICAYLALEYMQKVPYYTLLSKIYPNKERIEITRQLYHDFFSITRVYPSCRSWPQALK